MWWWVIYSFHNENVSTHIPSALKPNKFWEEETSETYRKNTKYFHEKGTSCLQFVRGFATRCQLSISLNSSYSNEIEESPPVRESPFLVMTFKK